MSPPAVTKKQVTIHGGQPVPGCKPNYEITMKIGVGVRSQNEATIRHPGKRCDSLLDFGRSIVDDNQHKFNAEEEAAACAARK